MSQLPTQDLRSNRGTWAVPAGQVPAAARAMSDALPAEEYDRGFLGQELATNYFDTPGLRLRKARKKGERYLTLRIRCYRSAIGEAYAISAKTEQEKFRRLLTSEEAEGLLAHGIAPDSWPRLLPAHLVARLLDLVGQNTVSPVTTVSFRRYAVEDEIDRFTLDIGVRTDAGKKLPAGVLEWKSTASDTEPPLDVMLRPIKLSKFLWATRW